MRIMCLSWVLLVLVFGRAVAGGHTVLTVGTDSTCDFSSIQSAVDSVASNNATEYSIRITNQQTWSGGVFVNSKNNLLFQGGYANCFDAGAGSATGTNTVLDGGNQTVTGLFVTGDSRRIGLFRITIQNFSLGGVIYADSSTGSITQTIIQNNQNTLFAGRGGGVLLTDQASVRVANSLVAHNQALNGGGLSCVQSTLALLNTTVSNNATVLTGNDFANRGKGGGIYATDSCSLSIDNYVTIGNQGNGFGKKIIHNTATIEGGGLFADDGSQVNINKSVTASSTDGQQVVFEDNQISHNIPFAVRGAGMAVSGPGTEVDAYQLALYGNDIDSAMSFGTGAGLYVGNFAKFSMRINKPRNTCLQENIPSSACNQIHNNTNLSGLGAGFAVSGDATADIYQTDVAGNVADDVHVGTVNQAELNMQGSLIHNNGFVFEPNPTTLINAAKGSDVHIDFSTIADNHLSAGVVLNAFAASRIVLSRSILAENNNTSVFADNPQNPSNLKLFRCLLTHENNSFLGSTIMVGDADFIPNSVYRLDQGSLGLAMCNHTSNDLFPEHDIDGQFRTGCTGQLCPPASFDAGADATFWFDVVFADDFEITP